MSPSIGRTSIESSGSWSMQISKKPTILVCGHNNRDRRCGVLGPLLRDEFLALTYGRSTTGVSPGGPHSEIAKMAQESKRPKTFMLSDVPPNEWTRMSCPSKIGLVSHIGGHAWAGNVIVYLPPDHRLETDMMSPLAGKGIWYGRVEPKHVEGIMDETIRKGRIIEELLRGVHGEIIADHTRSGGVNS